MLEAMRDTPHQLLLAGPPALRPAGAAAAQPLAPLDAALLAWLAIEGPTPRARLAALLWPEADATTARNSLRQRLFKLRRGAGPALVDGRDLLQLSEAVAHDLHEAHTLLGDTEPPVAGDFAAWLAAQRALRRQRGSAVLLQRAEQAEQAQAWPEALVHAQALLALQPQSEAAWRRLMRLHYLAGDRAAALQAFDRCERMLKDEIGTRPDPETLALLHTLEQAEAAARTRPHAHAVPAAVLRPPRLVGRDDAHRQLCEAWEACEPALVLGDAGMGKSRLLAEFVATRPAPARVLVTGARPGDERVVHASLSRLLRALPTGVFDTLLPSVRQELARLLPELGPAEPLTTEAQRTRMVNAVVALLASPALGLEAVVFDDLHFADDASIALLQALSAALPLRWLVGARPAEVGEAGRDWLQGFAGGQGVRRVLLPPLAQAQVAELVGSLALDGLDATSLAERAWRHGGGNPLFVLEAVKAALSAPSGAEGAGRLPALPGVTDLIQRRLTRLSAAAIELARCAAVAAPDFDIALACQVLGRRTLALADPMAELEAAHVLVDGAFAHDLVYESALASVPRAVALQLHADIAAVLQARGGEPARVAAHWLAAGHDGQALQALLQAAAKARAALRRREELEALRQAADIAERLGRRDTAFDALFQAFEALEVLDRTQIHEDFLARLQALADQPAQRLRALLACASRAQNLGDYDNGLALAEQAAGLARTLQQPAQEVEALRAAAACASFSGQKTRAVNLLRPALPQVLMHCTPLEQQTYFNDLGCCLDNDNQHAEAADCHRRALDLALQIGRLDQASISCANRAYSLRSVGQLAAALQQVQQARRHAMAVDEATAVTYPLDVMSLSLLRDLGRYDEALRIGEVALQTIDQNPIGRVVVQGHWVQLWLNLGQVARAQQLLAGLRADELPAFQRGRLHALWGRLQLATGQRADAALAAAVQEIPQAGRAVLTAMARLDLAETLDPPEALALCDDVRRAALAWGQAGVAQAACVRGAAAALRAGDAQQAAALAQQALQALDQQVLPDDLYRAELWLVAARAFAAAGDPVSAERIARQGERWVHDTAALAPAPFRASFLQRNAVNRALLALAAAPLLR